MANKLLLCISASQATAARWRSGRLTDCTVFENSEAGIEEFKAYASASGNAPAFVIVDAVEEDYRVETLPHASGSDRAQMVDRKLRQFYRGSPYAAASLIGRDSTKRRDDRFLFSALTNAELIEPWMSTLTESGLPVGGVYLLPLVISGLIEALGEKTGNLLLVAVQPVGIRLTFFREGAFRLSRLSRSDAEPTARDQAVIDEISNTRLYLHALRAATLDEPVTVVLFDHSDQLEETTRAIREDNPSLNCKLISRTEIESLLKLDSGLLGISPTVTYLQLLGVRAPNNNLAPIKVTAGFKLYQTRRQLFTASAVAAAIGVVVSGYNLLDQHLNKEQADDTARQTTRVNADYQAATLKFPAAPTSADNLRNAAELADKLQAQATSPERFMQVIGRALEPSPEIALSELGWQYRPGEIVSGVTVPGTANPPSPGTAATMTTRKHSGLLSGQVRDFKGDFRGAIYSINAFAERLSQDPAVAQVRIAELPLNVNPTLALTGNTADNPAQAGIANFKLIIVLKPPA